MSTSSVKATGEPNSKSKDNWPRAGLGIDFTRVERETRMEASRQSHLGDHSGIRRSIRRALA